MDKVSQSIKNYNNNQSKLPFLNVCGKRIRAPTLKLQRQRAEAEVKVEIKVEIKVKVKERVAPEVVGD